MSKKNAVIEAGLNGLLGTRKIDEFKKEIVILPMPEDEEEEQPEEDAAGFPEPELIPEESPKRYRQKKGYKTVCYSLPPDMVEAIRHISKYEGRKINDVVIEAFAEYLQNWDGSRRPESRREWINNLSFDGWEL